MKQSKLFYKSNKSAKEFDSINATLLQKGGFIEQTMAGVYTYLPLGLLVLDKIENLVREEMNKIGNEMFMPAIAPKQLWEQTGRFETIDVLFKVVGANDISRKKNDAEYVLNCTHEDIITPIAKKFFSSYKDFPFAVYQIQTKFRNEARAKSGIMRGREFRMKDLYSFHTSPEDLDRYYFKEAAPAYEKIFEKLGLGEETVIVLASGGDFTEKYSHEFQTKCQTGEDEIYYAKKIDTYYNKEVAPSQAPYFEKQNTELRDKEDVLGKGIIGVDELAKFLKIPVELTTKTIIYEADDKRIIAAVVRGDYDINEEKLRKVVKCGSLTLASEETVKTATGAEVGYAGPLNLSKNVDVYWDDSTKDRINFECGANRTDYHTVNVNFGRDVEEPGAFYDFKLAKPGDINPETGEVYEVSRASEVGNIFPLNTKFSSAIDYTFTDEEGKQRPVYMGSYGIGTSRIMGVLVEQFHDSNGITWPKSVTPYQVHLLNIAKKSPEQAQQVYEALQKEGFSVLYDDREISPGEKFAEADLIGISVRLVVSDKTGDKIEIKERTKTDIELLSQSKLIDWLTKYYQ